MGGSSEEHSNLVDEILLSLNSFGLFKKNPIGVGRCIHTGNIVKYGLPGTPDIEGILKPDGKYCGIEVKTGNAIQSKLQINFERRCNEIGGIYILARSVEDCFQVLRNRSDK